jgi:hypothetical protein
MAIAKQPSAKATALTGFVCKIKGDELCSSKGSSYPQTIPRSQSAPGAVREENVKARGGITPRTESWPYGLELCLP